jgi:hypothetical protein
MFSQGRQGLNAVVDHAAEADRQVVDVCPVNHHAAFTVSMQHASFDTGAVILFTLFRLFQERILSFQVILDVPFMRPFYRVYHLGTSVNHACDLLYLSRVIYPVKLA